jgi:hypothetical protein
MNYQLTSKLEINMLTPTTDPRAVSDFAVKNRCPAVVVAPEFAPMMLVDKSAKGGQFKLIAAIDFPDGKDFCLDKFKNLDVMSLEVDGMDIMMTKGRTEIEASNEAKTLVEFIRGSINPVSDIRFVLGYYTKEWPEIENLLKAAKAHPPDMIRVDQHVSLPNANAETHAGAIEKLRALTPKPLKISGNIDLAVMEHLLEIDGRLKFDVSIQQAMHIVNQIKQREAAAMEKRNV